MLIKHPTTKIVVEHRTCGFHKKYPGRNYPGCTCSGSYTAVVKPRKEWTEEEKRFMDDPFAGYGEG